MNRTTKTEEAQQLKPKRPLSAFNLFYRFKRQKVLSALAANDSLDKDTICGLVTSPPGLEHHCYGQDKAPLESKGMLNALRRKNIRMDLESRLDPRDTKSRSHRKNQGAMNGSMSFVELGKLMNSSWKACDQFAKSVFDELAEEGREKYRRLKVEYAKINMELKKKASSKPGDGCGASKKKKGGRKQQLPTKKSKTPKKKNKACSPLDSLRDGSESEEEIAMNETAEVMVQLAKHIPSKGHKICGPTAQEDSNVAALSLLDLLSKNQVPNSEGSAPAVHKVDSHVYSLPQEIVSHNHNPSIAPVHNPSIAFNFPTLAPPPRLTENPRLIMRVRELENQLAAERLRAQVRQLEIDMSQRRAREGLLRSVLDNVITQNRTTGAIGTLAAAAAIAPPPPALINRISQTQSSLLMPQDGLWSLVSAGMIHPSVQASERAAMLSRIVEPHRRRHVVTMPSSKRPSPNVLRNNSPTVDSILNKRQRLN